jgi:uncharacterized protein YkvS
MTVDAIKLAGNGRTVPTILDRIGAPAFAKASATGARVEMSNAIAGLLKPVENNSLIGDLVMDNLTDP